MNSTAMEIQDQTLMQCLLGNLSEAETERLDELSVSDDMLAMRLWNAENDLVDAYVRKELSPEDEQRFKSHYLTTPRRLGKVKFANSLRRFHQVGNKATSLPASPKLLSPERSGSTWRWQLALAAGIVLAVAAAFALDDLRLRKQLTSNTASLVDLTRRIQMGSQELEAQTQRTNALAADTQRLEALLTDLRAASAVAGTAKPLFVRVASFLLLPPKRGLETLPILALPVDAQQLEIRLLLEDNEFAHYRVSIKSRDTAFSLWQSPVLNASAGPTGASLKLNLEAATLKPGPYTFEVTGITQNRTQKVASYTVSIVGAI